MYGEHQTARETAEQFLSLAQKVQDPALLLEAYGALGYTLYCLGEFSSSREHLNRTTKDSYTFSLAVELFPFGLSVAQRSRRPPDPCQLLFDFAAGAATLRANGSCVLKECYTVPMSCGPI